MRRRILCTECDTRLFPSGEGEGFVDLCLWRERLLSQYITPDERIVAIVTGKDEPSIELSLDGEQIDATEVMSFMAGDDGWVVFFSHATHPDEHCPRCGDGFRLLILRGAVSFTAIPERTGV